MCVVWGFVVWSRSLGALQKGRKFLVFLPTPFPQDQLLGSSIDNLRLLPVAVVLNEGFLIHPVVQTNAGTPF